MEIGIYDGFEEIFTSFNFKCLKSDAKAFELLTKRLNEYGLNPEECLFVDDNLENVKEQKKRLQNYSLSKFSRSRRNKKN